MPALRLALILVVMATPVAAQENTAVQSPRLEFASPPFNVPAHMRDSIRFAWLTVPRDHTDPAAGTLRLAVSIIAAATTAPAADPIVVLPGGPGSGLVERRTAGTALSPRADQHRRHRAMVLMDPRGHGLSEPRTCPEADVAPLLAETGAAAEEILLRKLAVCRTRAQAAGERIDLLAAVHVARDLDWLRRALEAPQLNLIGASYGSRLVAEAMREVPHAVRSAMMHGPVPPGVQKFDSMSRSAPEVMDALFRRCAEQPECRTAFPDLRADYDTLLALIAHSPVIARVPPSDRAPEGRLVLDITLMRPALAELGYSRDLAAGAPLLIHTLARNGHQPLGIMAPRMLDVLETDLALDTHIAFRCNDAPPSLHEAEAARCRALLGDRFGDTSGIRLVSDVPALVFTGEFDPRTPPSDAHLLGTGLSRGRVIILPWYGHQGLPDCAFAITDAFIREPDRTPDQSCVDSIPPVRFATSVTPSLWVGRAVARAAARPERTALPAGAALLLLLVPFAGLPLRAARARRTAAPGAITIADIVLWLAAVAGIAFLLGTAGAVMAGARQTVLLPMLGVPAGWGWVLLLPWLLAVLALVAAVLYARHTPTASTGYAAIRWSGFIGSALLLALWLVNVF
jgi:pimeloyl-ACP methyl ester carboxylesterase